MGRVENELKVGPFDKTAKTSPSVPPPVVSGRTSNTFSAWACSTHSRVWKAGKFRESFGKVPPGDDDVVQTPNSLLI